METPSPSRRNVGIRIMAAGAGAVGVAAAMAGQGNDVIFGGGSHVPGDVRSKPTKKLRVTTTRRHLGPGVKVPETTLRERARKAGLRAAADAASLLNYHPRQEAPPAWARNRLLRLPQVWAVHVQERLGDADPAPVTFEREARGEVVGAVEGRTYVNAQGRRVVILAADAEAPRHVRFATVDAEGKRNKSRPSESSEAEFLARFKAA